MHMNHIWIEPYCNYYIQNCAWPSIDKPRLFKLINKQNHGQNGKKHQAINETIDQNQNQHKKNEFFIWHFWNLILKTINRLKIRTKEF